MTFLVLGHLVNLISFNLHQDFMKSREVGEFLSGALAGAMTKAILAPLETIRFCCFFSSWENYEPLMLCHSPRTMSLSLILYLACFIMNLIKKLTSRSYKEKTTDFINLGKINYSSSIYILEN